MNLADYQQQKKPQNDIEAKVKEFDRMFPQFVEYEQSHTDGTTKTIHAHLWLEKILTEQATQHDTELRNFACNLMDYAHSIQEEDGTPYPKVSTHVLAGKLSELLSSPLHFNEWKKGQATHQAEAMEALRDDFRFATGVIGHLVIKFGDENEVIKEMTKYIAEQDSPQPKD